MPQDVVLPVGYEPPADVVAAYFALSGKNEEYGRYYDYYDGDQPPVFLTENLRKLFKDIDVMFYENWVAVVIDTMMDRTVLQGFHVAGEGNRQVQSKKLFDGQEVTLEADEVHEGAYVTGESFVLVEQIVTDEGESSAVMFANDPRSVHCFYYEDNPREMRMAAKWWVEERGFIRLTLFYSDRIEYYISMQSEDEVQDAKSFVPYYLLVDDADGQVIEGSHIAIHDYGEIPVFHFRTKRRRPKSEIKDIIPLQNILNKLLNDMIAAAEFAAFRQKYLVSHAEIADGQLTSGPGILWVLPAADGAGGEGTQVGEFGQTDLTNFVKPIDRETQVVASISRTPRHFFFYAGSAPSGEALIAMEAPLNKKIQRRTSLFSSTWKKAWSLYLRLNGIEAPADDIMTHYERPETMQPLTNAQIMQSTVSAGMPLATFLRREQQWSDTEIELMLEEARHAAEIRRESLGSTLDRIAAGQVTGNGTS